MQAPITIYTTRFCPYCIAARQLLEQKQVQFEDIAVDGNPGLRARMTKLSGQQTVPQIWIGERHIGGYDDMALLERQGKLDTLLKSGQVATADSL